VLEGVLLAFLKKINKYQDHTYAQLKNHFQSFENHRDQWRYQKIYGARAKNSSQINM